MQNHWTKNVPYRFVFQKKQKSHIFLVLQSIFFTKTYFYEDIFLKRHMFIYCIVCEAKKTPMHKFAQIHWTFISCTIEPSFHVPLNLHFMYHWAFMSTDSSLLFHHIIHLFYFVMQSQSVCVIPLKTFLTYHKAAKILGHHKNVLQFFNNFNKSGSSNAFKKCIWNGKQSKPWSYS